MGHVTDTPQPASASPLRNDASSGALSLSSNGSTPVRPRCTRGPLIAAEGITGVGKTYLTTRAVNAIDDKPLTLDGFSQRANGRPGLDKGLLASLREASAGDPFLRGGAPLSETLILLAIKRHDFDAVLPELASGRAVVEGRSVDSTAVCQALLLHTDDPDGALETATALLDLASSYRPLPDLTILVTDDPAQAIRRAQRRDRCVITPEQATFMRDASALFERLAATDPTRYRVVDRRTVGEHEAVEQIRAWIHGAETDLGCLREPWQGLESCCLCCGHRPDLELS
jgi:dTMP kinase